MKKIYYLLLLVFSLANAQNPASIDPTFEFRDYVPQLQNMPSQFIVLSTGKVVAAGMNAYNAYNNSQQTSLPSHFVCLNKDFSVDEAFVQGSGFNNYATTVAVQPDDKVLVAGNFTTYNGSSIEKLTRLNSNGTLDNTFQFKSSGFYNFNITSIKTIVMQPDGKILVGGQFFINALGFLVVDLMRLNANGSIDLTFNCPNSKNIDAVAVQPDGKVLGLGRSGSGNNVQMNLVRYFASGAIDSAFDIGVGFANLCSTSGYKMQVLQTGKILVSGCFSKFNYYDVNGFVRLNTDGTLDATFTPPIGSSLLQLDETLVMIKPNYMLSTTEMVHTNTNGIVQETYTIPIEPHTFLETFNASGANEVVARMRVERTINGQVYTYYKFIHLDLQGNLKTEQQKTTHYGGKKILQKTDNEFLILGKLQNRGNRKYHNGIKRISGNGTLAYDDNLFNGAATSALSDPEGDKNFFREGVFMPDGKLVVLQEYYSGPSANTQYFKLIRYNTDFSPDTTFDYYYGNDIRAMLALPDGKLLIAYGTRLERLNIDGSHDYDFQENADFDGYIYTLKLLGNGQILVAGSFSNYLNAPAGKVARLNPNGSLDASFNASGIWSFVNALDLQSDGKIIIGGKVLYNDPDTDAFNLARLNSDGSLDDSFVKAMHTVNMYPRQVVVQPDNKILVIQQPQQYTTADCEVKRFNSDGTPDASFDTGSGFTGGEVNSILLQADGRIIVAGEFTRYNGILCNGSIRLIGNQSFVIQGQNKLDADNNGCDAADPVFPNLKLHVASADGGMDFIPDVTGNYAVTVPPGNFTITPVFENNAFLSSMPVNASVSFPTASPFAQDFCLSANGTHHDLEITLLPLNTARPGFDAKYKIVCHNKGNQLESGTVNLSFNGIVTDFVSGVPAVNSQTSNSLSWNFSGLMPFESKEFTFILNLNSPTETPPINASMFLDFTTGVSSAATDETPADNTFIFKQIVFNSYDPNDKTCLEGDKIPVDKVGEFVHYIIRFENTGTFAAQNIVVEDLIDTEKFDLSSLEPVSGSHLFTTRIQSGRVQFVFDNINLPFDDANNDGYLAFKIKTKASLVAGDVFSNSASIYFDYNAAINTNTANTVVQAPLDVTDFSKTAWFTIYPNPATTELNLVKNGAVFLYSVSVYNTLGQLVLVKPNARNLSVLDISNLSQGQYYLKLLSDQGTETFKFLKQ